MAHIRVNLNTLMFSLFIHLFTHIFPFSLESHREGEKIERAMYTRIFWTLKAHCVQTIWWHLVRDNLLHIT